MTDDKTLKNRFVSFDDGESWICDFCEHSKTNLEKFPCNKCINNCWAEE